MNSALILDGVAQSAIYCILLTRNSTFIADEQASERSKTLKTRRVSESHLPKGKKGGVTRKILSKYL